MFYLTLVDRVRQNGGNCLSISSTVFEISPSNTDGCSGPAKTDGGARHLSGGAGHQR